MSIITNKKSGKNRATVIGFAAGLGLWVALVAGLLVVPLDKGQSTSGIYALFGILMPYETETGERSVKPLHLPK